VVIENTVNINGDLDVDNNFEIMGVNLDLQMEHSGDEELAFLDQEEEEYQTRSRTKAAVGKRDENKDEDDNE
jgi:hypothetical protein